MAMGTFTRAVPIIFVRNTDLSFLKHFTDGFYCVVLIVH